MANIKTRIQLRNDVLSAWEESQKDLLQGEIALAKNTDGSYELRVGQAGQKWAGAGKLRLSSDQIVGLDNDLNALSTSNYVLSSTVDTLNPQTATAAEVKAYAVEQIPAQTGKTVTEFHNGDTLIIREKIADKTYNYDTKAYTEVPQYQHAAYVYDSSLSSFKAMDGTYNADSVYFDENLKYTAGIGVWAAPSTYGTLSTNGMSLEDVMKTLLCKEENPSKPTPTTSISMDGGTKEIGETVTPVFTLSFDAKKYAYGSNTNTTNNSTTGAAASTYNIVYKVNGTDKTLTGNWATSVSGDPFTVVSGTNIAVADVKLSTDYNPPTAGTYVPKSNLDNPVSSARVTAGTAKHTATASAFSGKYKMFYGFKTTAAAVSDISGIDSATIRALGNSQWVGSFTSGTTMAATNFKQLFFAAPKGTYKQVIFQDAKGANAGTHKIGQVKVKDASGTTDVVYDLFYVDNTVAATNTWKILTTGGTVADADYTFKQA